jgi:methionyl-tRNA formyltransferase
LVKVDGIKVLRVRCGDGSQLGIVTVQPAAKKEMPVKAFVNGLRGAALEWCSQ